MVPVLRFYSLAKMLGTSCIKNISIRSQLFVIINFYWNLYFEITYWYSFKTTYTYYERSESQDVARRRRRRRKMK